MPSPFDNEDGDYIVLVNHEGQHSIWPTHISTPDGWVHLFGPEKKTECLTYIEKNWTDMRPRSLLRQLN